MQRRLATVMYFVVFVAATAAAVVPANSVSAFTGGSVEPGILDRILSSMNEPVRLILMGISLIALSVVLRMRRSG